MRQLSIARYAPTVLAPERGVLTLLQAALRVAQQTLRDEHPCLDTAASVDAHAPLLTETAALIHGRCDELLRLPPSCSLVSRGYHDPPTPMVLRFPRLITRDQAPHQTSHSGP